MGQSMHMMMKALKAFWIIIALVIVVRFALIYMPTGFNVSFIDNIMNKITEAKEDTLTFPLKERKGFVLATIKGCIKDYKAGVHERGYSYDTSGQCMNGLCSLTVEFTQEVPKKVQLYVQNNGDCTLQTFKVPKTLETVGYMVNLQLTKLQKEHLGIAEGDEVKLEQANGHSFSGKDKFYYYDEPLNQDKLSVNDEDLSSIYFK